MSPPTSGVDSSKPGRFNKMVSAPEEARSARLSRAKGVLGARRTQMLRYQVVGQLESFLENRANDFRDAVLRSSIDEATRHQLLTINKLHALVPARAAGHEEDGRRDPG